MYEHVECKTVPSSFIMEHLYPGLYGVNAPASCSRCLAGSFSPLTSNHSCITFHFHCLRWHIVKPLYFPSRIPQQLRYDARNCRPSAFPDNKPLAFADYHWLAKDKLRPVHKFPGHCHWPVAQVNACRHCPGFDIRKVRKSCRDGFWSTALGGGKYVETGGEVVGLLELPGNSEVHSAINELALYASQKNADIVTRHCLWH